MAVVSRPSSRSTRGVVVVARSIAAEAPRAASPPSDSRSTLLLLPAITPPPRPRCVVVGVAPGPVGTAAVPVAWADNTVVVVVVVVPPRARFAAVATTIRSVFSRLDPSTPSASTRRSIVSSKRKIFVASSSR